MFVKAKRRPRRGRARLEVILVDPPFAVNGLRLTVEANEFIRERKRAGW